MHLVCIANRGHELADLQRPRGDTLQTIYPVTPGQEYKILGMHMWETVISVLTRDDTGRPSYLPLGLFEERVVEIPKGWKFGIFSGVRASGREVWTNPYVAAWGYPEFVDDPEHGTGLAEEEQESIRIFEKHFHEDDS